MTLMMLGCWHCEWISYSLRAKSWPSLESPSKYFDAVFIIIGFIYTLQQNKKTYLLFVCACSWGQEQLGRVRLENQILFGSRIVLGAHTPSFFKLLIRRYLSVYVLWGLILWRLWLSLFLPKIVIFLYYYKRNGALVLSHVVVIILVDVILTRICARVETFSLTIIIVVIVTHHVVLLWGDTPTFMKTGVRLNLLSDVGVITGLIVKLKVMSCDLGPTSLLTQRFFIFFPKI